MYGVEFLNDAKSVSISSFDRPLVYAFRGMVSVTNNSVVDRPAVGSVVYAQPINTVAPPRLFIRLNSSRHASLSMYVVMDGSSGNWTGFTIYAAAQGGGTLPLYVLDYVIARPSYRDPEKKWGMQIFDTSDGSTLFSTDERVVRFSRFTKKWTMEINYSSNGAVVFYTLKSGLAIEADDYIDVSFFNRGIVQQTIYSVAYTSVRIYEGGQRILELQSQSFVDLSSPMGTDEINFCTPICKFPLSKYPA